MLESDGLPARTTFVWDPITDQLVAVFKAEATSTTDANGGLIRQVIHGGMGYDDPIEVTIADPGSGQPNRLYPIYDEAAAGSLQAVINANGEVVSRALMLGAYGEDEASLAGVAIDRIAVKAKTDASGALSSVTVTMRGTEALNGSTAATGGRLASVTADHKVVRTTSVGPVITDNTMTWTLTPAQWADLTSASPVTTGTTTLTPNILSIAVTDRLRAAGWSSSAPILSPTATAASGQPIYDREDPDGLPVEYEASLSDMAAMGSGVAASSESEKVLYDIENLAMLSNPVAAAGQATPERLLVAASFQAMSFYEPATSLAFDRARWYDTTTGTFVSPDPLGYRDSSNLYAFCAGDPVNRRDPMGMGEEQAFRAAMALSQDPQFQAGVARVVANKRFQGGVRTVGGVLQGTAGAGALMTPEPTMVTKALGAVAIVRGLENTIAGGMQLATGKSYETATAHWMNKGLIAVGVSRKMAEKITGYTEAAVDLVSTAGSARAISKASAIQPRRLPGLTGLKFGENDLVYGPSAGGRLRGLANEAGGVLLDDIPKPPELTWEQFTTQTMEQAASSGRKIRFDLTNVEDLENVLQNQGEWANMTTAKELRYLQSNWSRFSGITHFYKDGVEVAAPWLK